MGLEGLTQFEIIQGFVGIINLTITTIVGLKILSKYFTHKKVELFTVGLMMIFVTSAWWGATSAFLLYVLFDYEISDVAYIFISYGLVTITSIFWLYSFGYLVYPKSKWKIVGVWLAICILYTIFFMYFLFTNPSLLAVRVTRFDSQAKTIVSGFILLSLLTSLITQYIFLKKSLASTDEKTRWMGKLVFTGFVIFMIVGIGDSLVTPSIIVLLIRILLLISAIISYIGWTMPDKVSKWLIKDYDEELKEISEENEDVEGFFALLSSRRTFTPEEVKIYKERKICLVCKGKASRYTFICDTCEALYCQKCADALIELENVCWVCNNPLDETKPIKSAPFETEIETKDIFTKKEKKKTKK